MLITDQTLPAPVQAVVDDVMLSVRTPQLIMKSGAIKKRLPARNSRTLRMFRYDRLPTAVVPLNGQQIPSTPVNRIDIDAKVSIYGLYVAVNQEVTLHNQDPKKCGVVKLSLIDLEAYGIS